MNDHQVFQLVSDFKRGISPFNFGLELYIVELLEELGCKFIIKNTGLDLRISRSLISEMSSDDLYIVISQGWFRAFSVIYPELSLFHGSVSASPEGTILLLDDEFGRGKSELLYSLSRCGSEWFTDEFLFFCESLGSFAPPYSTILHLKPGNPFKPTRTLISSPANPPQSFTGDLGIFIREGGTTHPLLMPLSGSELDDALLRARLGHVRRMQGKIQERVQYGSYVWTPHDTVKRAWSSFQEKSEIPSAIYSIGMWATLLMPEETSTRRSKTYVEACSLISQALLNRTV